MAETVKIDFTLGKIYSYIEIVGDARAKIRERHGAFQSSYGSARHYLSENIKVFRHNIEVCESQRTTAEQNKQIMEEQIQKLQETISAMKDSLQKLEFTRNDLERAWWAAEDACDDWMKQQPEMGSGEGAQEAYKRALDSWAITRDQLHQQRAEAQRAFEECVRQIDKLSKKIKSFEEAVKELRELIKKLEFIISELNSEHSKLYDSLRSFEGALDELEAGWNAYVSAFNSTTAKLELLQKRAEGTSRDAESAAQAVSALTGDRVTNGERLAFTQTEAIAATAQKIDECANAIIRNSNRAADFTYDYKNRLQDGILDVAAETAEGVNVGFDELGKSFSKIAGSLQDLSDALEDYVKSAYWE